MSKIENDWWAEKYRPKTIEEYSGNTEVVDYFNHCISTNTLNHLLLYNAKSGTGKCLDFSELIDIEIELTDREILKYARYIT